HVRAAAGAGAAGRAQLVRERTRRGRARERGGRHAARAAVRGRGRAGAVELEGRVGVDRAVDAGLLSRGPDRVAARGGPAGPGGRQGRADVRAPVLLERVLRGGAPVTVSPSPSPSPSPLARWGATVKDLAARWTAYTAFGSFV